MTSRNGSDLKMYFYTGISGFLLTLAFPDFSFFFIAWAALFPFLTAISDIDGKAAFKAGFFMGIVHYSSLMYWTIYAMRIYGYMPYYMCIPAFLLFIFYLALYPAFFALLFSKLMNHVDSHGESPVIILCLTPSIWTALEYIRSILFTGLPWELLGASQHNFLHIIQIADIFGVYGISFLIVLVNTMLFIIQKSMRNDSWGIERRHLYICGVITLALVSAALYYGEQRITNLDAGADKWTYKTFSVIQGNIDQSLKWDKSYQNEVITKYISLSLKAGAENPDLIVWPETSTPFYFGIDPLKTKMVIEGLKPAGAYFLIGSPAADKKEITSSEKSFSEDVMLYYNRAYLLDPNGDIIGSYDKSHLVPFGEYVPLKHLFPFIGKLVQEIGDFSSGKKGSIIEWNGNKIGVLICFEQVFPYLLRALSENGADVLVNITNDAWFGMTSAPYQHFSMGVFRAVESRKSLIRAANTGKSGFIDPVGRVVAETEIFEDAELTKQMPLNNETTVYVRFGDWFAVFCLLTGFIGVLIVSSHKYNSDLSDLHD